MSRNRHGSVSALSSRLRSLRSGRERFAALGVRMREHSKPSSRGPTRRQMMLVAGASALALPAGMWSTRRTAIARGMVFEDRSGAGVRDAGDRGVAGVLVSNGRDVVRTGADGEWQLPVAEGDSVFVIKPPHWSTRIGPGGLPQCSYLFQPNGSPGDVRYQHAGVSPTGVLPSSIDFALRRRPESKNFQALLLADTQPANDEELGYLRDDIIAGIFDSN